IGQAVMALGGTIEYFRDTVFNYPTMAEAYKVAAFNGLNKLDLELLPCSDDELDLLSSIDELTELCAGGTM
ncbi:MAG TPA: hypothetical protein VFG20_23025, partial [Planctomycetaceae bacterium]|nr:hypothetical protein [Planctomycetaceae bacterium]